MAIKNRLADKLAAADQILKGARNPSAMDLLAAVGYHETRIQEGQAHYRTAEQAYIRAQSEQGEMNGVSQDLETALQHARWIYSRHVRMARAAFKGDMEGLSKLGVDGRRKRDLTGWLRQASDFYEHALNDNTLRDVFTDTGLDQAALSQGNAAIAEVRRLYLDRQRESGEAQQARLERDAALANLDTWLSRFVAIARVALEDSPAALTAMGL